MKLRDEVAHLEIVVGEFISRVPEAGESIKDLREVLVCCGGEVPHAVGAADGGEEFN